MYTKSGMRMQGGDLYTLYDLLSMYLRVYGENSTRDRQLLDEIGQELKASGCNGNPKGAGRKRYKYTAADDERILEMRAQGLTMRAIAAECGCSLSRVEKVIAKSKDR